MDRGGVAEAALVFVQRRWIEDLGRVLAGFEAKAADLAFEIKVGVGGEEPINRDSPANSGTDTLAALQAFL